MLEDVATGIRRLVDDDKSRNILSSNITGAKLGVDPINAECTCDHVATAREITKDRRCGRRIVDIRRALDVRSIGNGESSTQRTIAADIEISGLLIGTIGDEIVLVVERSAIDPEICPVG